MDVEKIKKLAQEILSACGESAKEDDEDMEDSETPEMESEDGEEEDGEEDSAPSAMSGKNLAVLIALKKKMGKK